MPRGKKAGRVRDKWRDKKWVVVNTPASFRSQPVAYIPVTEDGRAVGRIIEITLFDLDKSDPEQHTIKLYFQVEKIDGNQASTRFKGHELAKEFLRSLIRRGSSIVNDIGDYTTTDGYKFRISTVAFTQRRVNSSKKHMIREIIRNVLNEELPKLNIDQFVQAVVYRKIDADLHSRAKRIIGIKRIAVRKTKLLSAPGMSMAQAVPVEASQQGPVSE